MTWKKYTPPVSNSKVLPPLSLTVPDEGKQSRPFLSIDKDTLKQLGWKLGDSLQIEIGEAEHAGKLRLAPMTSEPTTLKPPSTPKAKRWRIPLGRMPCLTNDGFKGPVAFSIDKGALIVSLPDAARSHQLPRGTAAAVARVQK